MEATSLQQEKKVSLRPPRQERVPGSNIFFLSLRYTPLGKNMSADQLGVLAPLRGSHLRSAAAPRVGSLHWHGSFASGASGRAAFRVLRYPSLVLSSCSTLIRRSLRKAYLVHPPPHFVRHLPVAGRCHNYLASARQHSARSLPPAGSGLTTKVDRGYLPDGLRPPPGSTAGHVAAVAAPFRPSVPSFLLLSRPGDRQFLATIQPTSLTAPSNRNLSFQLASAPLPPNG